jgi:hypothetical protein
MYQARIGVLATLVAVAACGGGSSTGGLDAERTYTIGLNSSEEVPAPRPTSASGTAQVIVFASRIEFQLSANNITGITMAHIHSGAPGVAGPVVVTLFLPGSPTGSVNGVFASGTLDVGNLPAATSLDALKTLLASGNAYINVHTTANATGEIRGQLR